MRKFLPLGIIAVAIAALVWGASRLTDQPVNLGAGAGPGAPETAEFRDPGHNEQLDAGDHALGGRVLSSAGRAVSEARVEVFSLADEAWLDAVGRQPVAVSRTDRNGHFRIPDAASGAYVFLVHAEGMGEGIAVLPDFVAGETRRVVVRLPPLAAISGRVEDHRGIPVPGARILVQSAKVVTGFLGAAREFSGIRVPSPVAVEADAEGTFIAEGLPASVYDLVVDAPGLVTARVYTVTAPAADLTVRMRQGITVRGTVTWGEGKAPESIRVWAEPDGTPVMAEMGKVAGTFELVDLPPGDHVVQAWATGFGSASGELHLKADQPPPEVDLRLLPGTVVSGRVSELYSGQSIPLARVIFSVVEEHHQGTSTLDREQIETGPNGTYRVVLPPGRWVVRAEANDHVPLDSHQSRRGGSLSAMPFDITPEGGDIRRDLVLRANYVIRGRVLYPDGRPAEAYAYVSGAQLAPGEKNWRGAIPRGRGARTDRDGYFRIEGVAPFAIYQVSATMGKNNVDRVGEVAFAPGTRVTSTRELTIGLPLAINVVAASEEKPQLSTASGRIVDEHGSPVPIALISVGGVLENADGEGRFRIAGIPPGIRGIHVVAPLLPPATLRPVLLKPGVEKVLGELVLPDHGVMVMGTAYSWDHTPISGVRLEILFSGLPDPFVVWTDPQGRYEIEGPAVWKVGVSIQARSAGFATAGVREEVMGTRVIDIVLSQKTFVTLEIAGAGSEPPMMFLELKTRTRSARSSRVMRAMAPTGKDTWTVRGIPPGTYNLVLRAAGWARIDLGTHLLREPGGHDLGRHLLTRGGMISGRVVDQARQPVAGALVRIYKLELVTTTDGKGMFRFEHVPEGSHHLRATGRPRRPRRLYAHGAVTVRTGKTVKVTLRLR